MDRFMRGGVEATQALGLENLQKAEAGYTEIKALVDDEHKISNNTLLHKIKEIQNHLNLARQFGGNNNPKRVQLEEKITSLIEELNKKQE